MPIRNAPLEQRITSRMNKNDRIDIVNLHHGLGQCRKDTWEDIGPYFASENISLNFREVSTLQSVYRYELTETVELSLADLARRIHLKNAVTSQTVTHLVDKGLMRRVIADDDRRKVIISLTERGREIAEGIESLEKDDPRRRRLSDWFEGEILKNYAESIVDFDRDCALAWGQIKGETNRNGRIRPDLDAQIAATARVHGMTVVTRNVADMAGTGVETVDPFPGDASV